MSQHTSDDEIIAVIIRSARSCGVVPYVFFKMFSEHHNQKRALILQNGIITFSLTWRIAIITEYHHMDSTSIIYFILQHMDNYIYSLTLLISNSNDITL